jgi:hypothetical protein
MPHRNYSVLIIKITWLMLFRKVSNVHSDNHMKHINILCRQIPCIPVVLKQAVRRVTTSLQKVVNPDNFLLLT